MEITKIVVTGGPCGGKSTAMSKIQEEFTQKGYIVVFVPETATELINSGVSPKTCGSVAEYQKCQLKLQIEKEKVYEMAIKTMKGEKALMVCDRGCLDNKAYMSAEDFENVLEYVGSNEVELRDNYDAVFHLVTAAKGAVEYYTTKNNSARTETPEEAAAIDDRLIAAWTGHPHLRVIDNLGTFSGKMEKLINEISHFLGMPKSYEIERKFLIEYPDVKWLEENPACEKIEISQTYLKSVAGEEARVRKRGQKGNYVYFKTVKSKGSGLKRIETEEHLSEAEYNESLLLANPKKKTIEKTRYCLTYKNQYFEIDLYPFWQDKAIMEIELSREDEKIIFPNEIKIIKEVTNDKNYKNANLAKL